MNRLSDFRIERLAVAFAGGLSTRKAAVECGVNRNSVLRYFQRFRSGWQPPVYGVKPSVPMMIEIAGDAHLALEREAVERTITARELAVEILENAARDHLFAAVLDD